MKIRKCSNINFGIKRLYLTKLNCPNLLCKANKKDFYISELEVSDKDFMDKNIKKWKNTYAGKNIIYNFMNECEEKNPQVGKNKRYFVVESPKKNGKSQIKAMCLCELIKNNIYISYLQSEREYPDKKRIKGLGSSIIYAIVNLAKQLDKNSVTLTFGNNSAEFYQKIGFIRFNPFTHNFFLHRQRYENVLNTIKNKYQITDIK